MSELAGSGSTGLTPRRRSRAEQAELKELRARFAGLTLGDLTLNVDKIPARGLSPLAVKIACALLVMQVQAGKADALANLERAAPRLRRYITKSGALREPRLRPLTLGRRGPRERRARRATLRRSPSRSPGRDAPGRDDDEDDPLDDSEAAA